MRTESKSRVKNSISRAAFVALAVMLQALWIVFIINTINEYFAEISLITTVFAVLIVLYIFGKEGNSAMKMPWIMFIFAFPVFGVVFYILCGTELPARRMKKKYLDLQDEWDNYVFQNEAVMAEIQEKDKRIYNQVRYIEKYSKSPICKCEELEFFPDTMDAYNSMLKDLESAKNFILMEYFAIEDAECFDGISAVLKRKVKEGVEVRIMYDDIGSLGFINPKFARNLEKAGIQCRIFNPLIPFLNLVMNNRDHRKITVIDGKVAYTGGYNLANEYFNMTHPYGIWKDSGVRFTGNAVRNYTRMLLHMWNMIEKTDTDYKRFFPEPVYVNAPKMCDDDKGYIQPFGDAPFLGEHIGESIYMNILKNAKDYVYITTPYLIITDEMKRELCLAAKRGVDVRIITPGIPDKKIVYKVTRSYYAPLAKAGVRIYEFKEGFFHAKQWVSDDEVAVVGTVNMDYRSLYLHFENGVYMYKTSQVKEVLKDCRRYFGNEVTQNYKTGIKSGLSIFECLLRIISPLL